MENIKINVKVKKIDLSDMTFEEMQEYVRKFNEEQQTKLKGENNE